MVAVAGVLLPGERPPVVTPCWGSVKLLDVGLVLSRIIVVVAPAAPAPWLVTVAVTVTLPPVVREVGLTVTPEITRSGKAALAARLLKSAIRVRERTSHTRLELRCECTGSSGIYELALRLASRSF